MNNKIILPLEIINKILIMRQESELNKLIKFYIDDYKDYIKGDDGITFSEYILKLNYLYNKFNIIKKKKKINTYRFKCEFCKMYVIVNEYYYISYCCFQVIVCEKCFIKISNLL
jgi:hypothetical protein